MSLDMDAVIDTPDATVDMKSGLDTLQGVSDTARCIAEAVLTGKVPQRQTHKSDVRTTLKQSFSGSYGHVFSIDVFSQAAQDKLIEIGRPTLVELISYFLNESVYKPTRELSNRAKQVVNELGDNAEILTSQLRKSPLRNLHEVIEKFGYAVKIRHRISRTNQIELARFDEETAETLYARILATTVSINAAITRLNINTGNGRLLIEDEYGTVAFGFDMSYIYVPPKMKRTLSENLNYNNGRDGEHWDYLHLAAQPVSLPSGKIVKYIIKEILS